MTSNPNIGQEQALRECPFCESDTCQTAEVRYGPFDTKWAVECVRGCEMHGPVADDEAEAIAAWNQRSTPTPAQVEPVTDDDVIGIINLVTDLAEADALDKAYPAVWDALEKIVARAHPPAAGDSEAGRLREEIAALKLDLAAQECLQDSAYKAGLGAGWNYAHSDDEDGFQRARSSTEHIAELKRIRDARAALAGSEGGR